MRILCFGDSNTYGYDPRSYFGDRYASDDRWPDLLAKYTNWEILNDGCNGRRIPEHYHTTRELAPVDIFLIMLGTNDLLQGASPGEAAARMENFLASVYPHHHNILLVAPPALKRGAWVPTDALVAASEQLAEAYAPLAQRQNVTFLNAAKWDIDLAYDGVHFTEAGHHAFAKQLAAFLLSK